MKTGELVGEMAAELQMTASILVFLAFPPYNVTVVIIYPNERYVSPSFKQWCEAKTHGGDP